MELYPQLLGFTHITLGPLLVWSETDFPTCTVPTNGVLFRKNGGCIHNDFPFLLNQRLVQLRVEASLQYHECPCMSSNYCLNHPKLLICDNHIDIAHICMHVSSDLQKYTCGKWPICIDYLQKNGDVPWQEISRGQMMQQLPHQGDHCHRQLASLPACHPLSSPTPKTYWLLAPIPMFVRDYDHVGCFVADSGAKTQNTRIFITL